MDWGFRFAWGLVANQFGRWGHVSMRGHEKTDPYGPVLSGEGSVLVLVTVLDENDASLTVAL